MALEQLLTTLIASLDANTAALKGAKAPAAGAATTAKTTATKVPEIEFDALKVAAGKVSAKHGKPYAKKMIKDVGGASELATVKPEKFGALYKAFEAALAETAPAEEEEGEDEL